MKESLRIRIQGSYDKYGWTNEQVGTFEKWLNERCANFKHPENTIRGYLDTLNCIVSEVKKPFSEMTTDDLFPILARWEEEYSEATIYGRKRKLKAFLRWESDNRHDPYSDQCRFHWRELLLLQILISVYINLLI